MGIVASPTFGFGKLLPDLRNPIWQFFSTFFCVEGSTTNFGSFRFRHVHFPDLLNLQIDPRHCWLSHLRILFGHPLRHQILHCFPNLVRCCGIEVLLPFINTNLRKFL